MLPEGHLCCGSAGTYNILQPDIARRLRDAQSREYRKIAPDVIAAGNIGCITQIAAGTDLPVVHTVELIDWATGGPCPQVLGHRPRAPVHAPRRRPGAGGSMVLGSVPVSREPTQVDTGSNDREDDHGEEGEGEDKDQKGNMKKAAPAKKKKP